jgi:hypothetical protein
MKSISILAGVLLLMVAGCKKNSSYNSQLLIFNGGYSVGALQAGLDGNALLSPALAPGQLSGTSTQPYLKVPAGTHDLQMFSGAQSFLEKNIFTGSSQFFSILIYDSSTAMSSPVPLLLSDNLNNPDTAVAAARFLNLAYDTVVDVVLLNATDTIPWVGASRFIGPSPDPNSLQGFQALKHGNYRVYFLKTGTSQVFFSPTDSVRLAGGKFYSVVLRGKLAGAGAGALQLNIIQHPTP